MTLHNPPRRKKLSFGPLSINDGFAIAAPVFCFRAMAYTACSLILPCALGDAPLAPACLRLGLSCCFFCLIFLSSPPLQVFSSLPLSKSWRFLCPCSSDGYFWFTHSSWEECIPIVPNTFLLSPYKHYLEAMLSQELKGLLGASLPPVMPEHKAFSLTWANHSTHDLQLYPNHPCLRPKLEQCHSNSSCCLVTQQNRWNNCRSGLSAGKWLRQCLL